MSPIIPLCGIVTVVALAVAGCSTSPMTCASYSYVGTYAVTFDAPHAPNGPCPDVAPTTWSVRADGSVAVGAIIPKGVTITDPPELDTCWLYAAWHEPPSTVEPTCAGSFVASGHLNGDFNVDAVTGVLSLASTCGDGPEVTRCVYSYTGVRKSS